MKLADIESKTVEIFQIIDKFDINKALKDLETYQKILTRDLVKLKHCWPNLVVMAAKPKALFL